MEKCYYVSVFSYKICNLANIFVLVIILKKIDFFNKRCVELDEAKRFDNFGLGFSI